MLAGILFLTLIVVVGVLITIDVVRTPSEASASPPERYAHGAERPLAAMRADAGVHAFARDPAVRDKPVPPAAAAAGLRATAPVDLDSLELPVHASRGFDPMRRDVVAAGDGQRGTVNGMFVNLSRRSQALVERQLRLIESLEHGEQDRQRLASLSRLNRIAMRMHRNSQNLLVLAGQEPATSWNQPVTLAHLVEAALSEIEDFERVSFEVQPDIAVRGPAVHDAVHLLVELIDNATSFSAADMPVHIKGQILTSGGALIDITDRGIGMPAKEMAYANQQLDNPPPLDIDVPKWMGLLVVGRLALRHGIRIRLNHAELGGLTALVWLPDEILTHYAADPGYPAEQRTPVASPAAFMPARTAAQEVPATRAEPAWSARGPQAGPRAEPATAVRASSARPDMQATDVGMVMSPGDGQGQVRGLPIFEDVESRWSRGGRHAPDPVGQVGLATASGPVATPGPAAGGTPAGGPATGALPRRSSPSVQAQQRTIPGLPPGPPARLGRDGRTGFQRGASQGWASPADEANPANPDES